MKRYFFPLLIVGILVMWLPCVHSGELREYHSPDGMLKALVISQRASRATGESRIELRSIDGSLLFSQSYVSEDGEHGFGVEHAA